MNDAQRRQTDTPEFMRRQYEFAAHIRNPEKNPKPTDVETRRMAVYSELFYNNVEGFLDSTFPVLRSIMSDAQWHAMARDFFEHHHCKTPYFLEIPEEFLDYLQNERKEHPEDPPFLLELAHYEWVELGLSVDEHEIPTEGIDPDGNMIEGIPVLSPLAWNLQYQYDVHHIDENHQPSTPPEQATCLAVYRNREDEVGFLEINAVTARLLELMQEQPDKTGKEYLTIIAAELNHPDPQVVINGGKEIMQQLREADVILGTLEKSRDQLEQ